MPYVKQRKIDLYLCGTSITKYAPLTQFRVRLSSTFCQGYSIHELFFVQNILVFYIIFLKTCQSLLGSIFSFFVSSLRFKYWMYTLWNIHLHVFGSRNIILLLMSWCLLDMIVHWHAEPVYFVRIAIATKPLLRFQQVDCEKWNSHPLQRKVSVY